MKQPRRQVEDRGSRLVSPVPLLLISVLVTNPVNRKIVRVQAVLDSGCTRTLVNPHLVEMLEIGLEPLAKAIRFTQMDGGFSEGGEVTNRTAPLHLDVETHWECFQPVVAPKAAFPLILGLDWLRKHDLVFTRTFFHESQVRCSL